MIIDDLPEAPVSKKDEEELEMYQQNHQLPVLMMRLFLVYLNLYIQKLWRNLYLHKAVISRGRQNTWSYIAFMQFAYIHYFIATTNSLNRLPKLWFSVVGFSCWISISFHSCLFQWMQRLMFC